MVGWLIKAFHVKMRIVVFVSSLFAVLSVSVEQVSLTYGSSPSEVIAMWGVFGGNSLDGKVEFGTSQSSLQWTVNATASSYAIDSYSSPMIYKAKLTNLNVGNKVYYYRVGSESAGFSPVRSFRTHPGVGVSDVTFHLIGDPGQTSNTETTFEELGRSERSLSTLSGAIVCLGDLSYANGNEPLWDSFGRLKESTVAEIPMFSTVGNHEWFDDKSSQFISYLARFDNPLVNGKRQLYYSFDAGLVHWVMVSGYCSEMKTVLSQPCLQANSDQMKWLQKDLASVDKSVTPWTFVVFHQPYINSNLKHDMATEGKPMQDAIEDVLYEAKVDIVFSGHVHAYERSCAVYKYKCTPGAPYYLTIGDGGNAEGLATTWLQPQPEWSVYRQASYGFGKMRVFNSTHAYWSWHQNQDLDPVLADEFWYVKGSPSPSQFLRGASETSGTTREPVFARNARGAAAEESNAKRIVSN